MQKYFSNTATDVWFQKQALSKPGAPKGPNNHDRRRRRTETRERFAAATAAYQAVNSAKDADSKAAASAKSTCEKKEGFKSEEWVFCDLFAPVVL
jgi:hypothetical protein